MKTQKQRQGKFFALLRAINLPGHNKVAMEDLRGLLVDLGFQDGQSLLQTGNLIFRSDQGKSAQLERLLEDGAKKRLGLETDFMVRSAADLKTVIEENPFPNEAAHDPSHLLVFFLTGEPNRDQSEALQRAIKGREVVRVIGRHAYIMYPDGIGRSRLTNAIIEKHLGVRGTGRNWNTVLKLDALAKENPSNEPKCSTH